MTRSFNKVFKTVTDIINKLPVIYSKNTATDRIFKMFNLKTTSIQNAITKKSKIINLKSSQIIQNLNAAALQKSKPMPKLLVTYVQWYQQITGLNNVELSKKHVIDAQDKLFKCQDQRQLLMREADTVNQKLKQIYSELIQTRRDEPKYVQLTILENKALQEQSRITNELTFLEGIERNYFTQLTTVIKEYHDNQTMNAQKFKYLSILVSTIIAIISLVGSTVYNDKRELHIRKIVSESQSSIEKNLNEKFKRIVKEFEKEKNMNVESDIEKFQYNGYYVGMVCLALFVIHQILRS